jgi:AcrR family transcriptional regulator
MKSPAERDRPLRADARRNRDALVAAAAEIFRARGPDVSMLEAAEAAGVGVGTLYRNFPRRESLVAAVCQQGLEEVCDQAGRLLAEHPADEAAGHHLRLRDQGRSTRQSGLVPQPGRRR